MAKIPTIQQFADMSMNDIMKIPEADLKVIVSAIGSRLNKRLSHIRGDRNASHIDYDEVMESGGKFKTTKKVKKDDNVSRKPMTHKELLFEAQRERDFIKGNASTVRSARNYQRRLDVAALGISRRDYAKSKYAEYKKALKSDDPREALRQMFDYYDKSKSDKKRELIDENIDRMLKQKDVKDTSVYFKRAAEWAYNERVSEKWDEFHKWREDHMNMYLKGDLTQEEAKRVVERSLLQSDTDLEDYFDKKLGKYLSKKGYAFH